MRSIITPSFFLFFTLLTISFLHVKSTTRVENPFTPISYLKRYWNKQITKTSPKPFFIFNKASPLNASDFAVFTKLATNQTLLSTHLPEFCEKANLLCFPDLSPSLEKHGDNVNFTSYVEMNFTNYGTDRVGKEDSFSKYSEEENVVSDSFRRYSRDSIGHEDAFTSYATDGNVVEQSFNTYGTAATGGKGTFNSYNDRVNDPNLRFTSYSDASNGRKQSFSMYVVDGNSGEERFTSYGKNGNGENEFSSYGNEANALGSDFKNYGETRNGGNDTFTNYGTDTNVPENTFSSYGSEGNAGVDNFKSYRSEANVGDDSFDSYGKNSNGAKLGFENYGKSFNEGTDKFTGYGKDATGSTADFKVYGVNNSFKGYNKEGVTFAGYVNESLTSVTDASKMVEGKKVNKWLVEPGKFFREGILKDGNVMPMPDIRDKMPKRSFLPRVIVSKLPFSTSKIGDMKKIFHALDNSALEKMFTDSLTECERAPSPGETKRCVSSIEDMIDFSTSVLGRNVAVRTTENTQGYNDQVMIGKVKGVNGGKVTKSVSCHQSLFPYMLYYCHSVPKVRVYEADILDPVSKTKINHGVAICHLDTSSWSPGHGAFIALGSSPGKIEVCHWIFENDMTWTVAD